MQTSADKEKMQYSSWQLVRDILYFVRPYRGHFWFATFIRVIRDLASLYPAFAFAMIVDYLTKYEAGQPLDKIYTILALWLLAMSVRAVANYFSKKIGFGIGEKIGIDASLEAVHHMFKLDMAWHERENSGNKLKRIQNAGRGYEAIVRIWFGYMVSVIVNLVFINIIISQFDTTVLLLVLLFCIIYFFISGHMQSKARNASREVNIEEENFSGLLFEGINNIKTIKVMSMANTIEGYLSKIGTELFQKIRKRIYWYQSRISYMIFLTGVFKTGIILFIIHGVINGHYELGFLVLFNSYFNDLTTAIDELSSSSVDFSINKVSIARMKKIMNEPINIENEFGKVEFPTDWKKISFKDVSFSYAANRVLDSVSFEIKKGEKVGLVGLSGAGKSTLFKLLLKEREVFNGDILFDEVSVKNVKTSSYFKRLSVVLQDTEVFNFSLKDNITITNEKERDDQALLNQAIETAHIRELVGKLPEGLDTLVGEKGIRLSGGERQRLGIARAVFKQPEILLLDEATSHLDLESEEKIRDSLHKFFENVTAVVIAHRLTTIKEMDKILVLEEGRIVESGSFDELYARKGRFYELWEKQNL